jgi:hypothetical protein
MWMNEAEIDNALEIIEAHAPQFYKYAKFLSDWRDVVNANSDGWAYWRAGTSCADALSAHVSAVVTKLRGHSQAFPTEAEFKTSLRPIRATATKRELKAPELVDGPPKPAAANPVHGIDAQIFLDAAKQHGQDSEPDHEVGDLQTFFRAAYAMLSPEQRRALLADAEVRDCLETGFGIDPLPDDPAAAEDELRSAAGPGAPKP